MLAAMLAAALGAVPVQAKWLEAASDHFRVYADGSEARVRALAEKLERFDKGMRVLHALPDSPAARSNPLLVYVLSNDAAIQRLCGQNGGNRNCANVAGFYNGNVMGSTVFTSGASDGGNPLLLNAQIVLFHEYSHHFMFENFPDAYPAWFVEGFAEFNSTAQEEKGGGLGFGLVAKHRAYGLVLGNGLPIAKLLAANTSTLRGEEREALYGRGWLLTHMLTFDRQRAGQLEVYLKKFAAGVPSLTAAEQAFGDLKKLNAQMESYKETRMPYVVLPANRIEPGKISVRELGAGEAALMPVVIRSKRGVGSATAAAVVADARRLATPFPSDPGAQHALMEAEYDAGDDDRAEASADRVLAVVPGDQVALLYKGMTHLRRATRGKAASPAVWIEARSWIIKANRADPDRAAPLVIYYRSYREQGVTPPPIAVQGLQQAFALVPQDEALRLLVARQQLADGDLKNLRTTLAPLAFDPHAPPDNPAARLIALIDADQKVDVLRAALKAADDARQARTSGQ